MFATLIKLELSQSTYLSKHLILQIKVYLLLISFSRHSLHRHIYFAREIPDQNPLYQFEFFPQIHSYNKLFEKIQNRFDTLYLVRRHEISPTKKLLYFDSAFLVKQFEK